MLDLMNMIQTCDTAHVPTLHLQCMLLLFVLDGAWWTQAHELWCERRRHTLAVKENLAVHRMDDWWSSTPYIDKYSSTASL